MVNNLSVQTWGRRQRAGQTVGTSPPTASPAIHDDRALPALTGIRFLAAGAVLLSHYDHIGIINVSSGLTTFLDGGRTAVSLFFVLSGFVLAYNYHALTGRSAILRFWIARFARLWPGALLGTAIGTVAVLVILAGSSSEHREMAVLQSWSAPSLTVAWLSQVTMTTGWFPFGEIRGPFNGPAWSIACEVLFYALFPLLIIWLRRWALGTAVLVAVATWLAQGLLILVAPTLFGRYSDFVISTFPPTHVPEFIAGIVAALWFISGGREWISEPDRRMTLLVVSTAAVVAISAAQPIQPVYFLMVPALVGLILALGARTARTPVLGWAPLVLLGEASYALYITHLPVGYLLVVAGLTGTWIGWAALAAMVGLSVVMWRFYETPVRLGLVRLGRARLTPADSTP